METGANRLFEVGLCFKLIVLDDLMGTQQENGIEIKMVYILTYGEHKIYRASQKERTCLLTTLETLANECLSGSVIHTHTEGVVQTHSYVKAEQSENSIQLCGK